MAIEAVAVLAWNDTIFRPEKASFSQHLMTQVIQNILNDIYFILKSKNVTFKYYSDSFSFLAP